MHAPRKFEIVIHCNTEVRNDVLTQHIKEVVEDSGLTVKSVKVKLKEAQK